MMLFLLVALVVATVRATRVEREPRTNCSMMLDGVHVTEEILLRNRSLLRYLAYDDTEDTLYFGFSGSPGTKGYISAKMNLTTMEYETINELTGYCEHTIDQRRHRVYAGCYNYSGHGGLYQYDSNIGRFVNIGEQGEEIRFIYYKSDVLYYSVGPAWHIFTYAHGETKEVVNLDAEGVWELRIDNDNNWIFHNWTGLYQRRSGSNETIQYEGVRRVNAMAIDAKGIMYVCDYDDLLVLNVNNATLTKVLDDVNCDSLAFDKDNNIIFTDSAADFIVRLLRCG